MPFGVQILYSLFLLIGNSPLWLLTGILAEVIHGMRCCSAVGEDFIRHRDETLLRLGRISNETLPAAFSGTPKRSALLRMQRLYRGIENPFYITGGRKGRPYRLICGQICWRKIFRLYNDGNCLCRLSLGMGLVPFSAADR